MRTRTDCYDSSTDFSRISHRQVARVEKLLNDRPRKSLGYKTPVKSMQQCAVIKVRIRPNHSAKPI